MYYRSAVFASLTLKLLLLLLLIIIRWSLRCLLLAAGCRFIIPPVIIVVARFRSCGCSSVGIELLFLVTNRWGVIIVSLVIIRTGGKIRVTIVSGVTVIVLPITTVLLVMEMVMMMKVVVDVIFGITIDTRGNCFLSLYWCC